MDKHFAGFKLRLDKVVGTGEFQGYASVYRTLIPSYNEKVMPGAGAKTIAESGGKVPNFYMHDPYQWIGMGMAAEEDNHGLFVHAKLNIDHGVLAREVHGLMMMSAELQRAAGLSIGFTTLQESEEEGVRLIEEYKLWEYSPTPPDFQAAPGATAPDVRSSFKLEVRRYVAECLTEMGITTPQPSDLTGIDGRPSNAHLAELTEVAERTLRRLSNLNGRS